MNRAVLFLLLLVLSVASETIKVSGNRGIDIQMAVNMADEGDTVLIPKGDYVFDESVVISRRVFIKGEGTEKSKVFRSIHAENSFWFFRVDGKTASSVRISGLAFFGDSSVRSPGILLDNGVVDFRVDNCLFEGCSNRAVKVRGGGRGVIDNNSFINNWPTAVVVFGTGEQAWEGDLRLGGENAVFVEDNYFEQSDVPNIHMAHHIASNNGSKYVFRYNTINDGDMASHAIDAHGNKFYWPRGSRSYEIYGNKIYAGHRWAGINIRGGDGVIFNNRFYGSFVSPVHLMHESRDGDGECSYPCEDQIRKLYMWDNYYNDEEVKVHVRHPHIIEKNRDFKLNKHSDYEPFTYPHPLTVE
ncbi:polysaccharide lyase, family 6 [Chitinispirillum alkaliphilum]|nr:polysaccharide lyase, family 6 [Chitinispirillum alkaliphilum]